MARRGTRITRYSGTTVWAGDYATMPSGVTIDGNAKSINATTLNSAGSVIGATVTSGGTVVAGTTLTATTDITVTGKIDLGTGTHYKYDYGDEPLNWSKLGSGGTSLSAGTMQVTTNLASVVAFFPSIHTKLGGATIGHHNIPQHLGYVVSTATPSNVTVTLAHNLVGVLTGVTAANATLAAGGVTLHWFAIGT